MLWRDNLTDPLFYELHLRIKNSLSVYGHSPLIARSQTNANGEVFELLFELIFKMKLGSDFLFKG